jgi:MerR family transcriptional regulator, light-induced transcriptional regulator
MNVVTSPPDSARHPIAVVAERCGLSQEVLRVWERRYGAVHPQRGPGRRRLYSDRDIERLTLLRAATRAGRPISNVARLSTAAIAALVDEDIAARERHSPTTAASPAAAAVVAEAFVLTQSVDAQRLDRGLRRAAAQLGMPAFLESVAAPLLRRIGDEWHAGRLTPAQEHVASSILHDIIMETMRSFAHENGAARLLVGTLSGERHVIGALLAGAAAAISGWNVIYLGADLPAADISEAARVSGVNAVAISIVYIEDRQRVVDEIRALRSQLPGDVALIAGGAGANAIVTELSAIGVRVETTAQGWLLHPHGDAEGR